MFKKFGFWLSLFSFGALSILIIWEFNFFRLNQELLTADRKTTIKNLQVNSSQAINDFFLQNSADLKTLIRLVELEIAKNQIELTESIGIVNESLSNSFKFGAYDNSNTYGFIASTNLKNEVEIKDDYVYFSQFGDLNYVYGVPLEQLLLKMRLYGFESSYYNAIYDASGQPLLSFYPDDYNTSALSYALNKIISTENNKKEVIINETESHYIAIKQLEVANWYSVLAVSPSDLGYGGQINASNANIIFITCVMLIVFVAATSYYLISNITAKRKALYTQRSLNNKLVVEAETANRENQAKSNFLSRMSHDIRTPMNGIIGYTNLAMSNIDDNDYVADCLNKIDIESKHLLTLLNDVLDMSKIANGKMNINNEDFSLLDLGEECCLLVESMIDYDKVEFVKQFDMEYLYVNGDKNHIRKILVNILNNACKFTKKGKIVFGISDKKLDKNNVEVNFTIADTGIGMSAEFQKHVYEEFQQEGREKTQGSGLGMTIVKELVDLLGGKITLESKIDVGSRFTVKFNLPLGKAVEEGEKVSDFSSLAQMQVLIVEDNAVNLEIISSMLAAVGVKYDCAENGAVAVEKFKNSSVGYYEAILMDVMMPVMDGLAATKAIRNLVRSDAKSVPIIAMTAQAYNDDIEQALACGMDLHIAKPLDFLLVYQALEACRKNKKRQ